MSNITQSIKPDVTLAGAQSVRITNLAITSINTEFSHALASNLKSVIIKTRTPARLKIAFVSGESGTKYVTIPKWNALESTDLSFNGKTLYLQTPDATTTVEIVEYY